MKQYFIPAKVTIDLQITEKELKKIPAKVGIITTIQHMHQIEDVQKQLPKSIIAGQVLGCTAQSAVRVQKKVDAFLYVGSGVFHPIMVSIAVNKPVYKYNPLTKKVTKSLKKDADKYLQKKQGKLIKFLSARRIGILVTTKPGQEHLKWAKQLASRDDDKEYYLFAFDTLNQINMDDFNFIDMWVDTACPRIADEK